MCLWLCAQLIGYLLIATALLSFSVSQDRTAVDHTAYTRGSESKIASKYHLLPTIYWSSLFQQATVPTSTVFPEILHQHIALILCTLMENYARNEIFVMWQLRNGKSLSNLLWGLVTFEHYLGWAGSAVMWLLTSCTCILLITCYIEPLRLVSSHMTAVSALECHQTIFFSEGRVWAQGW